jgi:hypothetical protein
MTEIDDRDLEVLPAEGRTWAAIRPNTAPAYYLGRPARLWITVMRPGRRRTTSRRAMQAVTGDGKQDPSRYGGHTRGTEPG